MKNGDIDNTVPPLLMLTLDVLAPLAATDKVPAARAERMHRWDKAVGLREVDAHTVAVMWQLGSRIGIRFDLAVWDKPVGFLDALRRRLEVENLPVREVVGYTSPAALGKTLAYRPDVLGVYDIPQNTLAYGGRYLHNLLQVL